MPFLMTAVQSLSKKNRPEKSGDIAPVLLAHYDVHARNLPWRMPPGGMLPDPYHVWLSEIMLQQTMVAAVIPYFHKFLDVWPDFFALADAADGDVMAAWAGLGYYARARNMLKCARRVVSEFDGQLPGDEAILQTLPGVGPYTAAAISAIAFGNRAVIVDANVERVVARLYAIEESLPAAKAQIRAATDVITPDHRSGDFAQAMMDLGAGYCSVRMPKCGECPISQYCNAYLANMAEKFPVKPSKKTKPVRHGTAYWAQNNGHVWLVERPEKGMLGGMRSLPDDGWAAARDGHKVPPFDSHWRELDRVVQHSFTHFTLMIRIAVTEGPELVEKGEYWPINSLDNAGLPTLFSKIAQAVLAGQDNGEEK